MDFGTCTGSEYGISDGVVARTRSRGEVALAGLWRAVPGRAGPAAALLLAPAGAALSRDRAVTVVATPAISEAGQAAGLLLRC